jgi:hypothetical protein
MKPIISNRIIVSSALVAVALFAIGCGNTSETVNKFDLPKRISATCSEPVPYETDIRHGTAGAIMLHDRGEKSPDGEIDCLWVGINDADLLDAILDAKGVGNLVGEIVADDSVPHRFYLDPTSISFDTADYPPEQMITIDQVEVYPSRFTPALGGYPVYAFPPTVLKYVVWP